MNWDGLGDDEDDDRFFESYARVSSVDPLDLASSGSDEDDFEDSRMSFVSTISSASIKSIHPFETSAKSSSTMAGYDLWMAEPGDIKERRKRLLQGMGLSSTKDMLRLASVKIGGAVSRKHDSGLASSPTVTVDSAPVIVKVDSAPAVVKVDSSPGKESRSDEASPAPSPSPSPSPSPAHSNSTAIVLGRSRSDGDIETFSAKTKQRREDLIGPISKQRLTRTSSGLPVPRIGVYSNAVKISPERAKNRLSNPNNNVLQSVVSDGAFGSFFLIKNLDTGKEFIVKEYNEEGMWNKLSDVQTGKQLTMEEFEKSVGYSPAVKELMRRQNVPNAHDSKKLNNDSYFSKSFRNSKRKGASFLKNIKGVASSRSISIKEHEPSSSEEQRATKAPSQWIKAHQHGKSYKEFTALHVSQEIQAHGGSIWTIKFSLDARFLFIQWLALFQIALHLQK